MSLDIIDSNIYATPPIKKETRPKNICKISFDTKSIEKINLSRTFHDPSVKATLPNLSAHFDIPTVVYTLPKIFNFDKFVNNLGVKAFLDDNCTLLCGCTGSSFVNKDHSTL